MTGREAHLRTKTSFSAHRGQLRLLLPVIFKLLVKVVNLAKTWVMSKRNTIILYIDDTKKFTV
jgi:hypothetical protein